LQHALLLVNPRSRSGQSEALDNAVQMLEESNIQVTLRESESEAHMVSQIEAYDRGEGFIIIAGGDGTISSALKSIYEYQRTLAIFPLGTANDLARSIGVPQDLLEAAKIIINGKRERINLGRVNDQYFVNVAHIGLGVDVTHELTPESKKYFGVFAYLAAFVKAIKRNRSFRVRIKDNGWSCSVRAIHLAVGSGRFYGGGNIVSEESTVLDGQLNLFCIKAQPWWQLLLLGFRLRNGTVQMGERVVCRTAQKFSIQTSKPREIEADGEVKASTSAEFEVLPEAIEMIVGDIPI
jgi:diacylglycerol kinase (ATP)